MSKVTNLASDQAVVVARSRRLDMGGMPRVPVGLFLFALVASAIVMLGSWYTLFAMAKGLEQGDFYGWWVPAGSILLGLASVIIVRPVIGAFKHSGRLRHAAANNDIVAARIARTDAATQCWIALSYALAQLIVVLLCQFLLANNYAVAKTFFFVPLIVKTFPLVLSAFWINVKIFLISGVLVLVWGLVVALAMFAPGKAGKPLRYIATVYVDVFRAMPAILVIYLVGFGLPLTGVPILKDFSLITYVVIALTLTVGAYVAEIYRAGIQSVHWSQAAAARSLGLSHMQTLRFVIVPQGIRQIIPPLLNALIALQKDTALVSIVGVTDAFNQSMIIAGNYYNLSAAISVAVLFIIISIPQTRFVERMAQRDRARMRANAG